MRIDNTSAINILTPTSGRILTMCPHTNGSIRTSNNPEALVGTARLTPQGRSMGVANPPVTERSRTENSKGSFL